MVKKPQVSIGLPVYNGENYLEEAIDSILAQTFQDFELIISDNASSDRTGEICEAYQAQDARIQYYRSETNRGAAWNFNHVFELASGEYFKWASHDDLIAPEFLSRCLEVLIRDSSAVISYPRAAIIGEEGELLENYTIKLNTDSWKAHERFRELLLGHRCFEIFGLIRTSALQRTPLIGNYGHGDGTLLAWLSLLGRFEEIPEILFFPRRHSEQSMNIYRVYSQRKPDYYQYTVWFDSSKSGKVLTPHWTILVEYLKAVWQSPIGWSDRIYCHVHIAKWIKSTKGYLLRDLLSAARATRDKLKKRGWDSIRSAAIEEQGK